MGILLIDRGGRLISHVDHGLVHLIPHLGDLPADLLILSQKHLDLLLGQGVIVGDYDVIEVVVAAAARAVVCATLVSA